MAWQGSLLSCFLSCAAEFSWEFRHARPRWKYLSCLICLASKNRFLTVCCEHVNRDQPDQSFSQWNWITCSRDFKVEDGGDNFAAWNHAGEIIFVSCLVLKGTTMATTFLNDSLSNQWNCLNISWSWPHLIHVKHLGMPLVADFSKPFSGPCLSAPRSPATDFSNWKDY